ncbi:MAG: hypothetical protein M3Y18_01375 [Candidatus Eremiobacteraeota bacterium]|nr:hypothetical protein [Candidatus Eremiobacteraeota bacterium]
MRAFVFVLVLLSWLAPATGLAARRDGALVRNSGSTNAAGYALLVWSDGQASVTPISRSPLGLGGRRFVRVDPALANRFLADAKRAKSRQPRAEACMKSASFGTVTTVFYHGYTSPDLNCPSRDPALTSLSVDVQAIVRETRAVSRGRPIGLPANEPRRAENPPKPSPRPR